MMDEIAAYFYFWDNDIWSFAFVVSKQAAYHQVAEQI